MQKIFITCFVALGLSFGSVLFAQDTTEAPTAEVETTETATPETETEVVETPVADDKTFPVAAKPKDVIGQEYVAEEHGDWKIICSKTAQDTPPSCRLYQLLKDPAGAAVAEISILALAKEAKAAAGVNFITPLGTLLTAQASMRIDSGQVKQYPFNWCENSGCIARFGLTIAELNNLKQGIKAVMSITSVTAQSKPLALNVSLKGFTAAWNALNAS